MLLFNDYVVSHKKPSWTPYKSLQFFPSKETSGTTTESVVAILYSKHVHFVNLHFPNSVSE